MRIIHFSDFHLRADHQERAESIIKRLKEALRTISEERKIDLIIFSGDMIDKAGKNFSDPKILCAFEKFKEMVILPLTSEVGLAPNRFVYTMGNHEIDRSAVGGDDKDQEITDRLKNHEDVDKYIHNDGKDQPRIAEYNRLRDTYWQEYEEDATIMLTPFQYGIKLNVDGKVVGVNCLNTAWRCYKSETDEHKIVLGKSQITDSRDFFEDCHIRLAVGHHHPNMMNPFETNTLKDLIARNYDAFFCGHTHDNDGEYVDRPAGSCFYFTSPGTLSDNESAERKYRNGFMVIDYEQDERYVEAQCYFQDDNADFVREENYGRNGKWHRPIPGSTIVKPMALSLFCQKVEGEFLRNDKINDVIQKLQDSNNATIQLVALSGLGKTRILREAFKDGQQRQNCYYCEFSDNQTGLIYDVTEIMLNHKGQDGIIVLDNCPNSLLEKVVEKRNEYDSQFRIIGVNNEYYDRTNMSGLKILQIYMTQDDMKEMVEDFITRRIPEINGGTTDRDTIKKIADGFPGMAVLMVNEYLREQNVNVHTVDHVVKKLLKFEEGQEKSQEIVLRTLSLFQPCPYRNEYKEAFRFIREDEGITPLFGKSIEEKRHLFSHTIGRYDNSLIEISQCWLNVRPFPLAVWLVGRWFEDDADEERMEGIVERIQNLDKPMYTVIRDGLYKRLEYMQDSEAAHDLIQRLTGEENAPFCNEKVVCSDLGSRLFLAMSSVNPGAIASCLYRVLLPKGVAWAKDNIIKEIRRNLIW
jgi:predicted MPP superfamily phosphohydrolase